MKNRISVSEVAELMNVSEQFIRIGLQKGIFPFGYKKQLGEYHGMSQGQRFFIVGVINYELAWRRKELLDLYDFTLIGSMTE